MMNGDGYERNGHPIAVHLPCAWLSSSSSACCFLARWSERAIGPDVRAAYLELAIHFEAKDERSQVGDCADELHRKVVIFVKGSSLPCVQGDEAGAEELGLQAERHVVGELGSGFKK